MCCRCFRMHSVVFIVICTCMETWRHRFGNTDIPGTTSICSLYGQFHQPKPQQFAPKTYFEYLCVLNSWLLWGLIRVCHHITISSILSSQNVGISLCNCANRIHAAQVNLKIVCIVIRLQFLSCFFR